MTNRWRRHSKLDASSSPQSNVAFLCNNINNSNYNHHNSQSLSLPRLLPLHSFAFNWSQPSNRTVEPTQFAYFNAIQRWHSTRFIQHWMQPAVDSCLIFNYVNVINRGFFDWLQLLVFRALQIASGEERCHSAGSHNPAGERQSIHLDSWWWNDHRSLRPGNRSSKPHHSNHGTVTQLG